MASFGKWRFLPTARGGSRLTVSSPVAGDWSCYPNRRSVSSSPSPAAPADTLMQASSISGVRHDPVARPYSRVVRHRRNGLCRLRRKNHRRHRPGCPHLQSLRGIQCPANACRDGEKYRNPHMLLSDFGSAAILSVAVWRKTLFWSFEHNRVRRNCGSAYAYDSDHQSRDVDAVALNPDGFPRSSDILRSIYRRFRFSLGGCRGTCGKSPDRPG